MADSHLKNIDRQHQAAALLFRQLSDCLMQLVRLDPLRNGFFHALLGLHGPSVQRLLRLFGLFIVAPNAGGIRTTPTRYSQQASILPPRTTTCPLWTAGGRNGA